MTSSGSIPSRAAISAAETYLLNNAKYTYWRTRTHRTIPTGSLHRGTPDQPAHRWGQNSSVIKGAKTIKWSQHSSVDGSNESPRNQVAPEQISPLLGGDKFH